MRRSLCLIAALALCSPLALAEDTATELKFATGLSDLGYHDLAAEQFEKLNWRQQAHPELRVRIALAGIANALAAAQAAPKAEAAVAQLEHAASEAAALAESGVRGSLRGEFLMRQGEIQLELGRARTRLYRLANTDAEKKEAALAAGEAYGTSIAVFGESAAFYRDLIDRIEAKPNVSDTDRRMRQDFIVQEVAAKTQVAWAQLRRAEFFQASGMEDRFKADLAEATQSFTDLSDAHNDILAGISAMLGRGIALATGGNHKEAVVAFDKVLNVKADRTTAIFRFQAAYEKSASQAALGEYEAAVDTLAGITEEFGALPPTLETALRMRYAETLAAAGASELKGADADLKRAEQLRAKPDGTSRRQAVELAEQSVARKRKAKVFYTRAIAQARIVANAGVPESRDAQVLLGQWLELPGLGSLASPTDLFARGEAAMQDEKFKDAAGFYEQALDAVDTSSEADQRIQHNALVQLARARMKLGDKAGAGNAFMQVAQNFPTSPVAEKTAVYATVLLGQEYKADPSDENTDAYIRAQELLVKRFPHNETARKAAFRLGELARDQERYTDAAELYANVDKASEFYERANYLAGYVLYQAYLKERSTDEEGAQALFARAEKHLEGFIAWADEQAGGSAEVKAERNTWAANSQLLLAQMYDTSEQPEKLLSALDDRAQKLFAAAEGGEDLVRRARLLRLAAHALLGGSHNDLAQAELNDILNDAKIDVELKAEAARVVGQNYVRQARRLKERSEEDASITEADVRAAFGKAKDSLQQSLKLNPNPGIDAYTEVARTLYHAGAYPEASRTFSELVAKFKGDAKNADAVRDARLWMARCSGEAGDWPAAAKQFEVLLKDFPRWVALRTELAETYGRDDVKRYADAAAQWKHIEETYAMGSADWLDARYERVRCLALSGDADFAYQLAAAAAISRPNFGGAARKDKFLKLAREKFTAEQATQLTDLTRRGQ